MPKKTWRTVTWTLPEWAADTITETLNMDAESPAFAEELREEIRRALESIRID